MLVAALRQPQAVPPAPAPSEEPKSEQSAQKKSEHKASPALPFPVSLQQGLVLGHQQESPGQLKPAPAQSWSDTAASNQPLITNCSQLNEEIRPGAQQHKEKTTLEIKISCAMGRQQRWGVLFCHSHCKAWELRRTQEDERAANWVCSRVQLPRPPWMESAEHWTHTGHQACHIIWEHQRQTCTKHTPAPWLANCRSLKAKRSNKCFW